MKTRAAVAFEAGKPLEIEEIDLDGPKDGEVLLRNVATGFVIRTHSRYLAMTLKASFQRFLATKVLVLWWK